MRAQSRRAAAGTAAGRRRCWRRRSRRSGPAGAAWPSALPGRTARSGARPSCARSSASGSAPEASARPTRAMPRRSAIAVATMSTRRVGVVDPVHRHLVDPQARALGEHQQLGVEEPAGVLDQRQQPARDVGADGLEAALGVGEAGLQRAAQEQVVAAGDDLALRAADDPRAAAEPGADREVGVPGDQRGDQREQRGQVGGQVDVAVGEHLARPRRPTPRAAPGRGPSPPAAPTLTVGSSSASARGDRRGGVGAGVVGDRDPEACTGTCAARWACSRRTEVSRSVSSL